MGQVTDSSEADESPTAEVSAEQLDPLVGQTLDGRFRIVDVIGKGAMGKVYQAVQAPLNRRVALKILDSRYGAGKEESFRQRFMVEAALTSKLNHPNTVRVLDYGGTKDGLFFLAMEYLAGDTLEKRLSAGPLPWQRAVTIGQQIARALREAHELGVVHRDLKPANVVLLNGNHDEDFVKVLDFGLVKSFIEGQELEGRAITQQGMLMGSPPYMAPEQGESNQADPRSDIYSLGTMLFEMLTGKPPFNGGTVIEVLMKHVHQPLPALVGRPGFEAIPAPLRDIVIRCLAKSPMDRFQSMDEVLGALVDLWPERTESREISARFMTLPEEAGPFPDMPRAAPKRLPVLKVAAGLLGAAMMGALATWALVPSVPNVVHLKLASKPSGATVSVNGQVLGESPVELERALEWGHMPLEVRFELPGFMPHVMEMNASAGRIEVMQNLIPLP
jgi:serine/threonine protein kinase